MSEDGFKLGTKPVTNSETGEVEGKDRRDNTLIAIAILAVLVACVVMGSSFGIVCCGIMWGVLYAK
jgi:hypothetical protein